MVSFNIFPNDGEKKNDVMFRKFEKGGAYTDVVADYRVSGVGDPAPKGSGIKDKSRAGNNVIRINLGVGSPTHYYRGTLVFNDLGKAALKNGVEQPKGERAGVFGTVTDKDGNEMDVSGWVRKTKDGKPYISCVLQEPYKKGETSVSDGGGADLEDDIPF